MNYGSGGTGSAGGCKIENCCKGGKLVRGWCQAHYQRWQKYGDPLAGRTPGGEPQRYLREVVLAYDGDECLVWPYTRGGKGYGRIWRDGRMPLVHRLVCTEIHGDPPTPDHQAAHSCGRGHLGCVTKRHLSWKTRAENQADRLLHGSHSRGERSVMSKLTQANVLEVRALKGKLPQREIAARFGVSRRSIADIQARRGWSWLQEVQT
jgi:hypothetical protein